jgi:hypothetical protein
MNPAISDPLKIKLEGTVVREFLHAIGNPYKVLCPGLPPQPDIMCEYEGTGKQVGIEVVSVYYDKNHAKSEWEHARLGKPLSYDIRRNDSAENIRLLAEALRRILAKSKKPYTVTGYLILVVFIYPQRLYLCDLEERVATLNLPTHHRFDEVFLMSQHGEVYRLFPNKTWLLR